MFRGFSHAYLGICWTRRRPSKDTRLWRGFPQSQLNKIASFFLAKPTSAIEITNGRNKSLNFTIPGNTASKHLVFFFNCLDCAISWFAARSDILIFQGRRVYRACSYSGMLPGNGDISRRQLVVLFFLPFFLSFLLFHYFLLYRGTFFITINCR